MRRFILSFLISVFVLSGFAQKGKVSSALNYIDSGNLPKAKDLLDQAIENDKTATWPKTYYAQGRLAQSLYESGDKSLMKLYTDPLLLAYESFQKSMDLDDKDQMTKLIMIQYPMLSNDFLNWAVAEFEESNFEKALIAFETLLEIQQSDIYGGQIDTAVVFNTGLTAYNAKQYEKALMYYDKCIEMEYETSSPYLRKYLTYNEMEDLENSEKVLIEAFTKFPEDQAVLLQLIDFYLINQMDQEAFENIERAKSKDSSNFSLYWAEGVLYMKQSKYDEAIVALEKSIEIKSDLFDTQFNMGVCYYNKASDLFDVANDIMDNAKYNKAVEAANVVFATALPYMERARELRPDDLPTLTSLSQLYYRLKKDNEELNAKYEEVQAAIKELEG
jgi:tetratricopeptide (TPR) repeat protein